MNWLIWYLIFPYTIQKFHTLSNMKRRVQIMTMSKSFICKRIFMPCNFFQKLNSMPSIFLRKDIFHSNLIDKNFNVHILYQNEYVKSAVQVQFSKEMYAISLGQKFIPGKKWILFVFFSQWNAFRILRL